MNKEKYLKEIEKRLEYLTQEQKQEEIFRISNELDSGNVVNDINVEVNNIYAKYKINVDREIKKSNNKILGKLDGFSKQTQTFINSLKKKSIKENLIIIRDILLIVLLISVLKIPFIAIETILFSAFGEIFNYKVFDAINLVIEICYVIFAIILFIRIFKKRFKEELKIK